MGSGEVLGSGAKTGDNLGPQIGVLGSDSLYLSGKIGLPAFHTLKELVRR